MGCAGVAEADAGSCGVLDEVCELGRRTLVMSGRGWSAVGVARVEILLLGASRSVVATGSDAPDGIRSRETATAR